MYIFVNKEKNHTAKSCYYLLFRPTLMILHPFILYIGR